MNNIFQNQTKKETNNNNFQYWSLSIQELLSKLKTSLDGLSFVEAEVRLEKYGYNELAKKKKRSLFALFLSRFINPLILILIAASTISIFLGEKLDALVIITMIFISVFIDFVQRYRSEEAAEKLKKQVSVTSTVIRDGQKKEIPTSQLVVGDIIHLSAGDIVPADCRIIEAKYLFVNQSTLTGESLPVEKESTILDRNKMNLPELTNCVFTGTTVISGSAIAVVVKTGQATEFGKISAHLAKSRPTTEFEKGLHQFSLLILRMTFILVIFVFFFHVYFRKDIFQSLLFALALAVGLTPEMLPMIIAINLSRGALRMSKYGVIVKDLSSIQNFGSMDVLCTDKTGTLTLDKIKLERYENITEKEDENVLLFAYLNSFYQTGLKSPLDDAILAHKEVNIKGYEKVDEVPFDFVRKRLSVIVSKDSSCLLITKGEAISITEKCIAYNLGEKNKKLLIEDKLKIIGRVKKLSQEGFRVLVIAYKNIDKRDVYTENDEKDLVFLGITAFLDPPKPTAKEGLEALRNKGIALKILTGDNEYVTKKICDEINLEVKDDQIVTGDNIDHLDDDGLVLLANRAVIFSRLTPDQKNRIILALKRKGNVVGYLGDGINDAPALKTADIGISVDNAVDVAKETADIILLTKSMRVLGSGVYEGRKTFSNIHKYILMGTSSNFGNMFSVAGASLFLPFLPMLPKQILLNNLLYDISQLSLAIDKVDEEFIQKPKKWDINDIKKFMLVFGPLSSIFDYLTYFTMLFLFKASIPLFQTAWFIESLVSQSLIIFSLRTRKIPFYTSPMRDIFVINILSVVCFALIIPFIYPLNSFFSFVKPPLAFYLFLFLLIVFYFFLAGVLKKWYFKNR